MTAEFLRNVPKVQLHCHLEGTVRPSTFLELAEKHEVALTYIPHGAQASAPVHPDPYHFRDFEGFLLVFAAVSRSLASPEDFERVAREYAQDAVAQNVMHAEIFVSPSVWKYFHPNIDQRACIEAIGTGLSSGGMISHGLIVDLTRNFGIESATQTAQFAASVKDLGVIGIGLGGDEARFPPQMFVECFEYARSQGLHCVAHAGEAAGAQSVRNAVEDLKAERIGHGVRALEDPAVVQLLAKKKIPLEICPTSNFLTGVALGEAPHPLIELDAAGCIVTIDADDPALFKTSVSDEYEYVSDIAGEDKLLRFIRNAVEASFASPQMKESMRARLQAAS